MNFIKKHKKISILILIIILIIIGCKIFMKNKTIEEETETSVVEKGNVYKTVEDSGIISLDEENVYTSAVGKIVTDNVSVGKTVTQGELLYKINTSEIDENIKLIKQSISLLESEYNTLKENYSNNNIFASSNSILSNVYVKNGQKIKSGDIVASILNTDKFLINVSLDELLTNGININNYWVRQKIKLVVNGQETTGIISNIDENIVISFDRISNENEGDSASVYLTDIPLNEKIKYYEEIELISLLDGTVSTINFNKGDFISNGSSVITLNASNNELIEKQNEIKSKKSELDSLNTQLKDYYVYAPISGTITVKTFGLNQKYDGNSMCIISNEESYKTILYVSEKDINMIKEGQEVKMMSDIVEGSILGKVKNISYKPATDYVGASSNLSYYPITISIEKGNSKIFDGIHVKIEIIIDKAENVLTINSDAILEGNKVYKVTNLDTLEYEVVEVELGISDNNRVVIKSGLSEGDVVLVYSYTDYTESEELYDTVG